MNKIAIKLTIRNEDDFLDEWFQYYISLGFINYIIYNDESYDNSINIINFYKNIVNITLITINTSLDKHYTDIFKYKQFDYILNIDIDEFLYINNNINLTDWLLKKKKEKISVIHLLNVECGNIHNFNNKLSYLGLETFKYEYMIHKNNFKQTNRYIKHFFDPNNSKHKNGHTSICLNNTKQYKDDIKKEIFKRDLFLFHLKTRNLYHFNKNIEKYRKQYVNKYRNNLTEIITHTKSCTFKTNTHINYSKNIFQKFYKKYGFLKVKNFFDKDTIQNIINQAKNIYKKQMLELKLINSLDINNDEFEDKIII